MPRKWDGNVYERETFEGALRLGEEAFKQPGCTAWRAKQDAHRVRVHDEESLLEIFQHYHDGFYECIRISPETHERLHNIVQSNESHLSIQDERTGYKLHRQQAAIDNADTQ